MWGGCFKERTAECLVNLNSSLGVDKRLYKEDITGSIVYAEQLYASGILTENECHLIVKGLKQIRDEFDNNKIIITENDEDIHSLVERRLVELIGEPGNKLHTGRSRNDQSVTDLRLWILNNAIYLENILKRLIQTIVVRAEKEINIIIPGYTHLQRAQPVKWSHFILSHAWNFKSDIELLKNTVIRTSVLPLGSGAIAGNPFDLDRENMAKKLGFLGISMNSMNAVGNRDFVAEFLFWCSLCGTHLSRLAQDLIIFSTSEFGFLRISDSYSTGSSLLPQKRNADGLELARSSAAIFLGNVTTLLATLHALPSTYNKDLQGDKKLMFDSFDTICQVLEVVNGTIRTLTINNSKCVEALGSDLLSAHLANWLVGKGVPFRTAHHLTGQVVTKAEELGVPLPQVPKRELIQIHQYLSEDLSSVWDVELAVEENQTPGGTSTGNVLKQIQLLNEWNKQN